MNKLQKEQILRLLNFEIGKIKESAKKTDEASIVRSGNWSLSNKKQNVQMAINLADQYLRKLSVLKKEIEKSSDNIPEKAEPVSLLKVEYDDGQKLEFVLVENAVITSKYVFVSTISPLGKAVLGKVSGDTFSYWQGSDGKNYSGRILLVE